MTVLVLDARWPDLVPATAFVSGALCAPVSISDAVPHDVAALADASAAQAPADAGAGAEGTWVTLDETDAEARRRKAAGEPVIRAASLADPVAEARRVIAAARERGEWERGQTHVSLLPYLAEEAGEYAEAARAWQAAEETGGAGQAEEAELLAELSDVLLQVLFHAEIARGRGAWDFGDVAARFTAKIRSRAPYLFDGSTGVVDQAAQDAAWAAGKARERNGAF